MLGRVARAAVFAGAVTAASCASAPEPRYEAMTSPASATGETGEVRGRITRHNGDAAHTTVSLLGDNLRAKNPQGGSLNASTDGSGYYRFDDIAPGEYTVQVPGSKHRVQVVVRAAQAVVLDIALDKPATPERHMAKPYGAPPARHRLV